MSFKTPKGYIKVDEPIGKKRKFFYKFLECLTCGYIFRNMDNSENKKCPECNSEELKSIKMKLFSNKDNK